MPRPGGYEGRKDDMVIKGLKKIAGESKWLKGYYSGEYLQINYDKSTGEAWSDYHYSLGQNEWSHYHDNNIINCGNIADPVSMADLREFITRAVALSEEV